VTFPVRLAEKDAIQATFTSPNRIDPFDVPLADKVAFLQGDGSNPGTSRASSSASRLTFMRKQIVFVDSEGSEIEKQITEVFAHEPLSASDADGETHEALLPPGPGAATPAAGSPSTCLLQPRTPSASCAS
jgi:TldD protein